MIEFMAAAGWACGQVGKRVASRRRKKNLRPVTIRAEPVETGRRLGYGHPTAERETSFRLWTRQRAAGQEA